MKHKLACPHPGRYEPRWADGWDRLQLPVEDKETFPVSKVQSYLQESLVCIPYLDETDPRKGANKTVEPKGHTQPVLNGSEAKEQKWKASYLTYQR